ncbi:MAG: DUF2779 domain-containing protein [Oscillospiraceae bacterium]|nr:DUF2779 domain-containing protein [Oscillospiraceae bacterium]
MGYSLSKSRYCSGLQCPKMLWLKKHKPQAYDDSCMNQSVLETGLEVGDLAMGLFGEFTEVPYGDPGEMIAHTRELINRGTSVIAEASFSYDGCFCSVDILKCLGNKRVAMYEVKSSTGVKEIYLHDGAFQYYVLQQLGYEVVSCNIVHLNNQYVRQGELDPGQLFAIVDITAQAQALQEEVRETVEKIRRYMEQSTEPTDDIGPHCFSPYDCGFFAYCTRYLPKPNVFDVHGLQARTAFKCYRKGAVSFEELNTCDLLSPNHYMQLEHELYSYPPRVDVPNIKDFLKQLSYPLYFLDFESFQPAIPPYDRVRPFQQIVFQYSLHYIEREGGPLMHKEFLAYPGADPRRALAEQLCKDIPRGVCIVAYNMSFEKTQIKGLAELYPDLAEHLTDLYNNFVDLMTPFRKKWYYCRAMQGSYSIKYVLPALFPDDPELDYHNLEGIHHGGEASAAFGRMERMSPEELETTRAQLLAYCGLDTYAMVKVWEKLKELCFPDRP